MRLLPVMTLFALIVPATAQTPCGQWENMPNFQTPPFTFTLNELTTDPTGSELYAGVFDTDFATIGVRINRWTGVNWALVGSWFDKNVFDLEFIDLGLGAELYVGMSDLNGQPTVYRFDGVVFQPLPYVAPLVTALAGFDSGTGRALYAATNSGVYRLQGTTWSLVGSMAPGSGFSELVVHDDGSGPALYVAGEFSSVNGVPVSRIARWNGTTWTAVGSFSGSGSFIRKLLSTRDAQGSALFALGHFDLADGTPANGVARWNGTSWTGLGSTLNGVVTPGDHDGMTMFDEGAGQGASLVVNSTLDGPLNPTPFCQRWDGANWSALPALPAGFALASGPILALDLPQTAGGDLIIGRKALNSTATSPHPTRLEACDLVGKLLCFGDGSTTACPCGNASTIGERAGCLNSSATAGALRARGGPSLSSDSLRLDGSGMTDSFVLYFQGTSQQVAVVFGNGLTCTGGQFVRFGVKLNTLGASSHPGVSDLPISLQGNIAAPGVRYYQARYRDLLTFCTTSGFNYTNSVQVLWAP